MRFGTSTFVRFAALAGTILVPAGFVAAHVPAPHQTQQDQQSAAQAQASQQAAPASDSQQPITLAEAARRAREQKKELGKPAHTWDNENLPKTPNAVSVVGQATADEAANGAPPASTNAAANPPASDAAASGAASAQAPAGEAKPAESKDKTEAESQLAAAKDLLQSLKNDLDILQRQYSLDQQSFYGKPNYVADREGAAALKAEGAKVDAKRQDVAAAQAKVDALQSAIGPAPADKTNPN